jgi:hypothetical protein
MRTLNAGFGPERHFTPVIFNVVLLQAFVGFGAKGWRNLRISLIFGNVGSYFLAVAACGRAPIAAR